MPDMMMWGIITWLISTLLTFLACLAKFKYFAPEMKYKECEKEDRSARKKKYINTGD
jgi:hypothetical protein